MTRYDAPSTSGILRSPVVLAFLLACQAIGPVRADDASERHWAFTPVTAPGVPSPNASDWVRTPVDAFVLEGLQRSGLQPARSASRQVLVRRVYLDLLGLPPTPSEQAAFLTDFRPGAWERLVSRLLARPEYGERWARHWLDVSRYAESNGYERDGTKPNAWRFRDYVIDALNRDLSFKRFVQEQLAGDEMGDSTAEMQIATTFLRLGTWDDEPVDPIAYRYDQLDDVLGATTTTFLAVTLRCARCHDHKFEPFSQQDYYRVLAVFNPLKRPETIKSATHREEHDRMVGTSAELNAFRENTRASQKRIKELDKLLGDQRSVIRQRVLGAVAKSGTKTLPADAAQAILLPESKRSGKQKELAKTFDKVARELVQQGASASEQKRATDWQKERETVESSRLPEPPKAHIWYEDTPRAVVTRLLKRGDSNSPQGIVEPGIPAALGSAGGEPIQSTKFSTGRRLWLARWMTSRKNPLLARVFVNRVWQHHFGEGLVVSESNFGEMGDVPVHQPLLDWLAADFMENGWQIKRLHRLLVSSSTYRMSSESDPTAERADPQERLLWRWRHRRLDAEVVRDGVLAASGALNQKMAGPSIYPALPKSVLAGQSRPGSGWGKSDQWEQARRSVYIFSKRSLAVPELDLLDAPNSADSCEQRPVSTTGPQALTFLNGSFMHREAARMASRLLVEAGSSRQAQVTHAFRLTVCRIPDSNELAACMSFLRAQAKLFSKSDPSTAPQKAIAALCLVLLNTSEFVYTQ